jgi:hypothetical protein
VEIKDSHKCRIAAIAFVAQRHFELSDYAVHSVAVFIEVLRGRKGEVNGLPLRLSRLKAASNGSS